MPLPSGVHIAYPASVRRSARSALGRRCDAGALLEQRLQAGRRPGVMQLIAVSCLSCPRLAVPAWPSSTTPPRPAQPHFGPLHDDAVHGVACWRVQSM